MSYSQQLLFVNNAASTLASAINSSATSCTLVSSGGAQFPSPTTGQAFVGTLSSASSPGINEIVLVTARSSDTLTIVRAQEGTAALAFNAGDVFSALPTAGILSGFSQTALSRMSYFTASGSFTIPDSVTTIYLTASAPGGGGGGGSIASDGGTTYTVIGASGGGGGAGDGVFRQPYSVTPGASVNFTIGSHGNGGNPQENGTDGGDVVLTGAISLTLLGGKGGFGTQIIATANGQTNTTMLALPGNQPGQSANGGAYSYSPPSCAGRTIVVYGMGQTMTTGIQNYTGGDGAPGMFGPSTPLITGIFFGMGSGGRGGDGAVAQSGAQSGSAGAPGGIGVVAFEW